MENVIEISDCVDVTVTHTVHYETGEKLIRLIVDKYGEILEIDLTKEQCTMLEKLLSEFKNKLDVENEQTNS